MDNRKQSEKYAKPINSRQKGKRGELELSKALRGYGFNDARRGQQYSGISGDADVVGLPGIHIECKRVERLDVVKAMKQSSRDAGDSKTPVVMHKKNNEPWLVTMLLDDWIQFYKVIMD